jgi:dethiobiotin synthetase
MNGLFITGTDTGVGKTTVTAGLARLLRAQGCAVRVCKPIATGARRAGGRWLSDDTEILIDAVAGDLPPNEVTRWAFPDPVAPPVAARRQGIELRLAEVVAAVRQQARPSAILLVEGVGGLLCPLTDKETIADLAAALSLPMVIVARRSLGTLNHTLLTLEVARGRGLPVAGVVVNETGPCEGIAAETNVEELRRRMDVPLLAVIPHGSDTASALGDIDWHRLATQ